MFCICGMMSFGTFMFLAADDLALDNILKYSTDLRTYTY